MSIEALTKDGQMPKGVLMFDDGDGGRDDDMRMIPTTPESMENVLAKLKSAEAEVLSLFAKKLRHWPIKFFDLSMFYYYGLDMSN